MDSFLAKKLGELLAFAQVGSDTLKRGEQSLARAFGSEEVKNIISEHAEHETAIKQIAEKSGDELKEITLTKAVKTGEKLKNMRDLYLKEDDWDDVVEIMEWLGFFEGAAVVHWALVLGSAKSLKNDEVFKLAERGMSFHDKFFDTLVEKIQNN